MAPSRSVYPPGTLPKGAQTNVSSAFPTRLRGRAGPVGVTPILLGFYGGGGGEADLVSEITSVALYYLKHCTVLQVIKSTDVAIP